LKSRDITSKKFKKVLSGYSAEEVDAFLIEIANDLRRLEMEIERIRKTEEKSVKVLRQEAKRVLREAEKQSHKMIADAENKAGAVLRRMQSEKSDLAAAITALMNQRDRLRHSLQQVIASQKDLIEILDYRNACSNTNRTKE